MLSMNERIEILAFENTQLKAKLDSERRMFAAMALQGLITLKGLGCLDSALTAKHCVRMADELIAELNAD